MVLWGKGSSLTLSNVVKDPIDLLGSMLPSELGWDPAYLLGLRPTSYPMATHPRNIVNPRSPHLGMGLGLDLMPSTFKVGALTLICLFTWPVQTG